MCTVVFIPGKNEYSFASLRDESPLRPKALGPELYTSKNITHLSTKDPLGGGTWIGANEFGNIIILLNGAFEKHEQQNNYIKSRGTIVAELLVSELPVIEWNLMNLMNVEPFTLIVWSEENLFELVWDGKEKFRKRMDISKAYIWSSSTLYSQEAKTIREELFNNWITMNPPISKLSLLNFFNSNTESVNGFIMNRNEKVKTLSYSFIEHKNNDSTTFHYFDLQSYTHHQKSIQNITIINNSEFIANITKIA
jgi:hypothetical protein